MNIPELYEFIRQKTGIKKFHFCFEEGKTEFTQEEAEELAKCIASLPGIEAKDPAPWKKDIHRILHFPA